ncbi:DUF3413 domain-containing protein [Celerinatantimonas diazotrophica]|uniref:Inner membrane protein YejM n=1 Tax=Celerinatantimonas diazotrophica TaxID=412034 RepID=A0A4R1J7Z6_9GAMM|nr:DUF3413 domain-containing protein [Celerinatantimonas diazotrophica]TCK46556.1 hypothetical protein EV690_3506 [Celerinatantimonas diazotrophica]CAG9296606.1 Inner membrane protein YejM [Celerinatantimonas diazotrophica]
MVQGELKYRDKVSQLISWGHWFCLGNIIITLLIAIRYLYIAHWPETFLGQAYMFVSWLGQFSFLPFMVFLLTLFPLSFLLPSSRTLRFLGAIIATIGISALAIDTQVFSRFYVHLNPMLWQLLIDKENNRQSTDVNLIFILVPLIFFVELLLARLTWVSLHNLERRKLGKPIAIGFFICFFLTHVVHVWADATIYRPITAQKINYPLFYPMTARNLLNSYGLIDIDRIRAKSRKAGLHDGNPLNYPEHTLQYKKLNSQPFNLLIVVVEGLRFDALNAQSMPNSWKFAQQSLDFTHHFSGSNDHQLGLYSLFYGLPTTYWKSIDEAHLQPVLFNALNKRDYQLRVFSSSGFHDAQLNQTVWKDIPAKELDINTDLTGSKADEQTVKNWQQWQSQHHSDKAPWFNYIDLTGVLDLDTQQAIKPKSVKDRRQWMKIYRHAAMTADKKIGQIITTLKNTDELANTVVIITSDHGQQFGDDHHPNSWGYGNNLSRYQSQVPLIIHWPGHGSGRITHDTSHLDIVPTLAQSLLGVQNSSDDYSTGTNLFATSRPSWILVGSYDEQAIYQKNKITLFNNHGDYQVRNRDYRKISARADMPTILQVLNELRRFYRDDS